jgi:hypothetical protein
MFVIFCEGGIMKNKGIWVAALLQGELAARAKDRKEKLGLSYSSMVKAALASYFGM